MRFVDWGLSQMSDVEFGAHRLRRILYTSLQTRLGGPPELSPVVGALTTGRFSVDAAKADIGSIVNSLQAGHRNYEAARTGSQRIGPWLSLAPRRLPARMYCLASRLRRRPNVSRSRTAARGPSSPVSNPVWTCRPAPLSKASAESRTKKRRCVRSRIPASR